MLWPLGNLACNECIKLGWTLGVGHALSQCDDVQQGSIATRIAPSSPNKQPIDPCLKIELMLEISNTIEMVFNNDHRANCRSPQTPPKSSPK